MRAQRVILLAGLLLSGSVTAETQERLLSCAALKSAESRLMCYDMLAESIGADIAKEADTPTGSSTVDSVAAAPTQVEGTPVRVSTVVRDVYGRIVLELSNGEFWRQDESGRYEVDAGNNLLMDRGDGDVAYFVLPDQSRVRFTRNP